MAHRRIIRTEFNDSPKRLRRQKFRIISNSEVRTVLVLLSLWFITVCGLNKAENCIILVSNFVKRASSLCTLEFGGCFCADWRYCFFIPPSAQGTCNSYLDIRFLWFSLKTLKFSFWIVNYVAALKTLPRFEQKWNEMKSVQFSCVVFPFIFLFLVPVEDSEL